MTHYDIMHYPCPYSSRVKGLFLGQAPRGGAAAGHADDEDEDGGNEDGSAAVEEDGGQLTTVSEYAAGKWGRYVRAPDFYFEVMREFGPRFVPLGEIVDIRFGVKSGCDAFFMPHDITREALERAPAEREFKRQNGVERRLVETGEIKMVRAGDGSVHPIESAFLKPEVHTLRHFQRPIFRSSDCDRVILLVGEPLERLKGTWVARYLRYGETRPFTSGKSKAVPVPKGSTCAARNPWYDLTKSLRPGFAFWPMAHQYRHVIPYNPESLICNHRMFDIGRSNKREIEPLTLTAILNSTVVALFKTFYGRFTGTEGSLDTEVIDVEMLEVPDVSRPPSEAAERILCAFASLKERNIGFLVEEELSGVHSPERAQAIATQPIHLSQELRQEDRRTLDDAVFELLGVSDGARRNALVNRLYEETARHFRQIRVVEIQKMEQRTKTAARRFTAEELAADAWDAIYLKDSPPIAQFLSSQTGSKVLVAVPAEGAPRLVDENSMFDREVVFFGTGRKAGRIVCASRAQAELVRRLASLGVREDVAVPAGEAPCRELLATIETQLETARNEFDILASSRTSNEKLRDEIVDLMMHWMIHGPRELPHCMLARLQPAARQFPDWSGRARYVRGAAS
jgi:hypothetical protein